MMRLYTAMLGLRACLWALSGSLRYWFRLAHFNGRTSALRDVSSLIRALLLRTYIWIGRVLVIGTFGKIRGSSQTHPTRFIGAAQVDYCANKTTRVFTLSISEHVTAAWKKFHQLYVMQPVTFYF